MKLILSFLYLISCPWIVYTLTEPIQATQTEKDNKQRHCTPFAERVNIQSEQAMPGQIIDNQWVVVGTPALHAFQLDSGLLYKGRPSFRFELREDDNLLTGYNPGETKGRIETSYCYATPQDFEHLPPKTFSQSKLLRTVYHHGKGQCAQGSRWKYEFAIWVPDTLSRDANTLFAQWHGMPRRNLIQTPQGEIKELTEEEFLQLQESMLFAKELGYEKIQSVNKQGKITYKKGKKNGWRIEQGGYPPLSFGFSKGFFYIKANSDSKWFSDKTDRTNADVARTKSMGSVSSEYKTSTLAYKLPIEQFPRNQWVHFDIEVQWSQYVAERDTLLKPGCLDVRMTAQGQTRHIVNQAILPIGRNDRDGYYFKHGIYRTSSSTIPVAYHLAGYTQNELK